jgi:glycosyltransferase involved in cell wall biosynthesis
MEAGMPERKIRIYTQWVDQGLFKPSNSKREIRNELGLNVNDFLSLFVGRLLQKKGVGVLLQVADRLPSDVKILFVGTGLMEKDVKKAEGRLRNVKLIGKVSEVVLADYYRASDLVVLPSQYDEGFSRVILEALSSGVPVITVDRGCPPEMINENVGRLINPTPEDVYEHIMYFYNNRAELFRLASNCRRFAEEKFSLRNAEVIEKAYRDA